MRLWNRWAPVLALFLLAAACGSGSDGDDATVAATSDAGAGDIHAEVADAAEALIDRWGSDRNAFYVVAWSLDAGYSARQILDAAAHEWILADGTITDSGGAVVSPAYEPERLLVAFEGEAVGPGFVVAHAGLPGASVVHFLADDQPQDAAVTGLGLLTEVFDKGLETFQEDYKAALVFDARATALAIELGVRGYSTRQILEGIMLHHWTSEIYFGERCFFLMTRADEVVRPANPPVDPILAMSCRAIPSDAPTEVGGTTTSSSIAAPPPDSGGDDDSIDGTYVGSLSVSDKGSEFATIINSRAEFTIADGVTDMTIDLTFKAVWVAGDGDNEPCVTTDHWILSGSGPAGPTIEIDLSVDLIELIAISGCERGDDDDDETVPFTGTIAGDVITGSFYEGLFVISAERR